MRVRRWLIGIGGALLLALGGLHTFAGGGDPTDEAGRRLFADMRAYPIEPGNPQSASMMDAFDAFSHAMAITFCALGALALVMAIMRESERLLRPFAAVNVAWTGAFVALVLSHHLTPPAILMGIVGIAFLAALLWPATKTPS